MTKLREQMLATHIEFDEFSTGMHTSIKFEPFKQQLTYSLNETICRHFVWLETGTWDSTNGIETGETQHTITSLWAHGRNLDLDRHLKGN